MYRTEELRIARETVTHHGNRDKYAKNADDDVRGPHSQFRGYDKAVSQVFAANKADPENDKEGKAVNNARADTAFAGHDTQRSSDKNKDKTGGRSAEIPLMTTSPMGWP